MCSLLLAAASPGLHGTLDSPRLEVRTRLLHAVLPVALGLGGDADGVQPEPRMARRDALSVGIRLLTRNGHDWASRYPLIVRAVNRLKVRSCLIDGEAVCCNERGVSSFDKLRHRSHDPEVFLVAFDLLELDGNDLRREPLEVRKQTLASLLRGSLPGVQFNAHLTHPGDIVFEHACKMGLEGIVSKRLGSTYRSGRTATGSSSRTRRHRR